MRRLLPRFSTLVFPILLICLLPGAHAQTASSMAKPVATIPVGKEPVALAIAPSLEIAAVANYEDNTVSVIDPTTQTVLSIISVGKNPNGVAIAANGTNLIATSNKQDGTLSLLNLSTGEAVTVPVGPTPAGVAVAPNLGWALIPLASQGHAHLVLVALSTQTVEARIDLGKGEPVAIAVDEGRKIAAVALTSGVILVDLATQTPQFHAATQGRSVALGMDPTRGHALLLSKAGDLARIDLSTGKIVATERVGRKGVSLAVNPVADEAWVIAKPLDKKTISLLRVSLATWKIVEALPLAEKKPIAVAANPRTTQAGVVDLMGDRLAFYQLPHPVPMVDAISPVTAKAGSSDIPITVTGRRFVASSVIRAGDMTLPTRFVSDTSLTAKLPASLLSAVGEISISIVTPNPGGGASASLPFRVSAAGPEITGVTPTEGTIGTTVTITGRGFIPGSTSVRIDGATMTVAKITPTEIQATVPPNAQTASIYVVTPEGTAVSSKVFTLLPTPSDLSQRLIYGEVLTFEGDPLSGVKLSVGDQVSFSDNAGRFTLMLPAGRTKVTLDPSAVGLPSMIALVDMNSSSDKIVLLLDRGLTEGTTLMVSSRVPDAEIIIPAHVQLSRLSPQRSLSPSASSSSGLDLLTVAVSDRVTSKSPSMAPMSHSMMTALVVAQEPVSATEGVLVIHPNWKNLRAGTGESLLYLDPKADDWVPYAASRVSNDGRRVLPVSAGTPPILSLISCGGPPPKYKVIHEPNNGPGGGGGRGGTGGPPGTGGDPVSILTGTFVMDKVDLVVPGASPIALQRTYMSNNMDTGLFGPGADRAHNASIISYPPSASGVSQIRYRDGGIQAVMQQQSDGRYQSSGTPALDGATVTPIENGGWTLRFKQGGQQRFSQTGQMIADINRHGQGQVIAYGSNGRAARIASTEGETRLRLDYDSWGKVSQIQMEGRGSGGGSVTYAYDGTSRLTAVTGPNAGEATRYRYDAAGRMDQITDPRGIAYLTNVYDSTGRVVKQTAADGGVTTFSYSSDLWSYPPLPPPQVVSDPSCNYATTITIKAGDAVPASNCGVTHVYNLPAGAPDGWSKSATSTDARGVTKQFTFSEAGSVTSETEAVGTPAERTTRYEYESPTHRLIAVIDPLGRRTEYIYDAIGNMLTLTRLAGTSEAVTTTFTYEPIFNQVASVTDALGKVTRYSWTFDAAGDRLIITDPAQQTTTVQYDLKGWPRFITDALGNTTTFEYDAAGNLMRTTDPQGNTTRRAYDTMNRLTALTDPRGYITRYGYDALNRIMMIQDAQGGQTGFTYDQNGNLLTVTDAKGQTTTYMYDNMDRLASRADALGRSEFYEYDANGNLIRFTDRKGQVSALTYDALNRRTQVAYADGSSTTFTYDAVGRLMQVNDSIAGSILMQYDHLDRLIEEVTAWGRVGYTYDAIGRRTAMSVNGLPPVTYRYDGVSRLTQVAQGAQAVNLAYDAAGRRTALAYPNGVVANYLYDNASRLIGISHRGPSGIIEDLLYTYDAVGNRISFSHIGPQAPLPKGVQAAYNAANQQVQVDTGTFTYDANGNLTSQTDANGTTTYTWDARNRLTAISSVPSPLGGEGQGEGMNSATFTYDALGRRVSKTMNKVETD